MNNIKLMELYKSWAALVKHKENMGSKILELIAHPEVSTQDIERWVPAYRNIVAMLREHRPTVLKALQQGTSWQVSNAFDTVKNTHL